MLVRELPRPYIETALSLFSMRGLSSIVEIGSMRQPLEHSLDDIDRRCCIDGHSSMYFAAATDDFITVDVEFWTSANTAATAKRVLHKYVEAVCRDGIEFLRDHTRKIDLLYLDAWDVFLPGSAERHLDAFEAAEDKLHDASLVLIDDTDAEYENGELAPARNKAGGKGRLLVPYMERAGWTAIFNGRQTLMALISTPEETAETCSELSLRQRACRDALSAKYPDLYPAV